jgi:nucleotide-binding universal stress UspA family protein
MYKHLLVPTDGTELSADAVREAIGLARSLDARMTFLYVQPDFPLPIVGEGALIAPESRDEFARSTQEQADLILREACDLASQSHVSASAVTGVSDVPYEFIISTAEKESCDLVFMASHGRRGLAGLLIGSETHNVLTHCKIPVLVYR